MSSSWTLVTIAEENSYRKCCRKGETVRSMSVLAALSWWVDCQDVGLDVSGDTRMPVDLSGMGLHGDYVGRRDGWEWPSQSEADEA